MGNLQYITFDQLMASVESDLSNFADNGLINRGTCIKVVRQVNHDIGLKIFKEKETTVRVENFKADLPEDFLYLQLALLCGDPVEYTLPTGTIWGTHTEEHNVTIPCRNPDKACLNSCEGTYWVTQTFKEKTTTISKLSPMRLTKKSLKFCADKCLNNTTSGYYEMDINNGEIVTGFREGDVYLSYLADMVDENNNVLVLDHPMLTPYYEYAVKKHILERILMNGDADVERRLGLLDLRLREARIAALNFINTIEYTDIQDVYQANRKRFYDKYQKMFYTW
jgi:hypothetical protein